LIEPLPFNSAGLLDGTANPSFPHGDAGEISVVATQQYSGGHYVAIAFRNNTDQPISRVEWAATATSVRSKAVDEGHSTTHTYPARLMPGEVGLAAIFFNRAPSGQRYEFSVEASTPDDAPGDTVALQVSNANQLNRDVVATVVNDTGRTLDPVEGAIFCFADDGNTLLAVRKVDSLDTGPLAPGVPRVFTVSLNQMTCYTFTVGVSGTFAD